MICNRKNKNGNALVSVIAGFVIFGVMLAGAAEIMMVKREQLERQQLQSNNLASASAAQVLAADGIDPTQVLPLGNASVFEGADEAGYAIVANTLRSQTHRAYVANYNWELGLDGTERANAMGLAILPDGDRAEFGSIPLDPPAINYSGELRANWFPLADLVTFPNTNPGGTTYHYTTDGSTPTSSSPQWDGSISLDVNTMYAVFSIRAYHPDVNLWRPSDTVSETYSLPEVMVVYNRQDGSGSTDFNYYEIDEGRNQIVLTNSFMSGFGRIVYGIDSDPNSSGPRSYSGAFHVPFSDWQASGIQLNAAVYSTNPNFSGTNADGRLAASIDRWTLEPVTFQLPAPRIDYGGTTLNPGSTVDVEFSGDHTSHGSSRGEIDDSVSVSSPVVTEFLIEFN